MNEKIITKSFETSSKKTQNTETGKSLEKEIVIMKY